MSEDNRQHPFDPSLEAAGPRDSSPQAGDPASLFGGPQGAPGAIPASLMDQGQDGFDGDAPVDDGLLESMMAGGDGGGFQNLEPSNFVGESDDDAQLPQMAQEPPAPFQRPKIHMGAPKELDDQDKGKLDGVSSGGQTMALDSAGPMNVDWAKAFSALPARASLFMAPPDAPVDASAARPGGPVAFGEGDEIAGGMAAADARTSVGGATTPELTGEHDALSPEDGGLGFSQDDDGGPAPDATAMMAPDALAAAEKKVQAPSPLQMQGVGQSDFVLQKKIGQGGQGEVWKAWQTSLSREVAVKRLKSGDPGDFLQESYTSGALDHPNIVPVYDLGRMLDENGREMPLLAMKLVQGTPWDMMIAHDRKKLGNMRTKRGRAELFAFLSKHLRIMIDMCNAVMYSHSKGIIHRDLKPAQVMVGDFGEVFLMDWGLAVSVEDEAPPAHQGDSLPKFRTLATAVNRCGSPAYMAPEQTHETTASLGVHTDIYLLGAILFELVQGKPPHDANTAEGAYFMAMANDLLPLPEHCPLDLRELIMRTLDTDPTNRPPSARDFRDALEDYLGGAGRKRESQEILEDVAREFETKGFESLGYEELTVMEQRLDQSLQLWPENPDAGEFRQHLLALHSERAIEHKDLQLARTLVLGLPEHNEQRPYLLSRVMHEEVAQDKAKVAQRKRRIMTNVAMGVAVVGLLFAFIQARRQAAANASLALQFKQNQALLGQLGQQKDVQSLIADEIALAIDAGRLISLPHTLDPLLGREETRSLDRKKAQAFLDQRKKLAEVRQGFSQLLSKLPEPFELAIGEANIALALSAPGDEDKAYKLYKSASEKYPARPEPHTGMGLASAWAGQGQAAIDHLGEAARLTQLAKGPDHPDSAIALGLTAEANLRFGQEDKQQIDTYRQIIDIIEPSVGNQSVELSKLWERLGDRQLSLHYAKMALPIYDRHADEITPDVASAMVKVAAEMDNQPEKHVEASKLYLKALKVLRSKLHDSHPQTAEAWRGLGINLMRRQFRGEALTIMQQALKSTRTAYGEESDETLRCALSLFEIMAWPRGGPIPADNKPQAVLALGSWIERRLMQRPVTSVDELRAEGNGWLYVEAAMASSAYKLNNLDLARPLLSRSVALANAAKLPPTDRLRTRLLEQLAEDLNRRSFIDSLAPPTGIGPPTAIDMPSLIAHLDGIAKPINWSGDPFGPEIIGRSDHELEVNKVLHSLE